MINNKEKKITLESIAGYKDEKEEIRKIIKIINNFHKYSKQGINIPKGLILQGPPGCGKTLLAKAISGECNVPFYSYSAEDSDGDVLKTLNDIFTKAHEKTPSIVYLDEINELVTSRRFSSDVSRKALQMVLTELDGFSEHPGVMIIASTNNYEDLPSSLLRSGRMDKKLKIDLPDLDSRIAIINFYIKDYSIFKELNVRSLAVKLKGMSGADIKTLINNALIEYIDEREYINVDDFAKLINDMNFETIGKRWNSKKVVTQILAHEVGHSIVGWYVLKDHGSISAVKYDGVNGFTRFGGGDPYFDEVDEEEMDAIFSKKDLYNEICCALGGMASEIVMYGIYNTGISGDLNHCKDLFEYGANAGLLGFSKITEFWRDESEEFKNKYVSKRNKIFEKQLKRAVKLIKKNYYLCRYLIDLAIENSDVLTEKQIDDALEYFSEHKEELVRLYRNKKIEE